ncbi:MAG: hypothetical protein R3E77_15625 [Steroidobacteraceae bacterium]
MRQSNSIALVTVEAARALDEDLPPLAAALTDAGYEVASPSWRDATVEWSRYRAAILRSTWDYTDDLPAFLDWARTTAAHTQLINPPQLIEWNTDKHYLLQLAAAGVPVIASQFADQGPWSLPTDGDFVIKPAIGAGSRGARRFTSQQHAAAASHALALRASGHCAMLQPYLASVDSDGETALVYFAGSFSHAVRKGALLQRDGGDVTGLFATEQISPREPAADELAVGQAAVAAIAGGAPLYARVDLIRDEAGAPRLLELELTEPSLFFNHAPGSARHLASALTAWLERSA